MAALSRLTNKERKEDRGREGGRTGGERKERERGIEDRKE